MAHKTYSGSCYCKRVKFSVELDLADGTHKCNCQSCWKRRLWIGYVKPDALTVISGEEHLHVSEEGSPDGRGYFCSHCGVVPYLRLSEAEWNGGRTIAVNLPSLDDLDPVELANASVDFMDGFHDNWWQQPAETRHM